MRNRISDIINGFLHQDDPILLQKSMVAVLQDFGFEKFSYLGFNPPNSDKKNFVQSTFPEDWVQHYHMQNYIYIDPVVLKAKSNLLPFMWQAKNYFSKPNLTQKKFFSEGEDFGIKRGVVIPVHAPGGEFATLALTSDESEKELNSLWRSKIFELHLIAIYYHAAIWSNVIARKIEPTPVLTPREMQCLEWSARGKTVWETSEILSISEATVKTYLREAMGKLNTYNKTHAVSKALVHGLIKI